MFSPARSCCCIDGIFPVSVFVCAWGWGIHMAPTAKTNPPAPHKNLVYDWARKLGRQSWGQCNGRNTLPPLPSK